jgi:predicted PurR-regulated permease PerM
MREEGASFAGDMNMDQEEAPSESPPAPTPAPTPAPEPVTPLTSHLQSPVAVRNIALIVLAVLALLAVLKWAAEFLIPLMLGFMFSFALSPIVEVLARWRIPRAVSAAVLILGLLAAAGAGAYAFSDDANQLVNSLPSAATKVRDAIRQRTGGGDSTLKTVQKAAAQLEQAAEEAGAAQPAGRGVQRVVIEKPRFNIRDHLWTGTLGLASLVGEVLVVTFLAYFLLVSGDTFRRKLVRMAGPSLSSRKITVEALNEITQQIQRYLMVQLFSSVVVGVVTGLSFWAMGLNHAGAWGIGAGVLNLIPYIGSVIVAGGAGVVAFVQFGDLRMPLAVAGASLLIHTIQGNLIVPWLTSKASSLNAVAVFVGVLAWGWLWGVWGLLLGVPILMVLKAICDRVEDLKPVGELLGN